MMIIILQHLLIIVKKTEINIYNKLLSFTSDENQKNIENCKKIL